MTANVVACCAAASIASSVSLSSMVEVPTTLLQNGQRRAFQCDVHLRKALLLAPHHGLVQFQHREPTARRLHLVHQWRKKPIMPRWSWPVSCTSPRELPAGGGW
jgi:hypothetical protein